MSEATGSGWDDLQYPYGILNIKGGDMPSYPNFVRGNLKLGNGRSPCYASLNMTSEITPFFNSNMEVINVKKFVEDGGIMVLNPEKTYVIKMPKWVKLISSPEGNSIRCIRYLDCRWESKNKVTYEYTHFIKTLNKTRMSLNLELYDKSDFIEPWNVGDNGLNLFTVSRFQTFSSGNTLDTIMTADPQMYCYQNRVHKLQNIRKPDLISTDLEWVTSSGYSVSSIIADIFFQTVLGHVGGIEAFKLKFCNTPLKMFTEEMVSRLDGLLESSSYERKLTPGSCESLVTTNTTNPDPNIKNKTRLPHTLTMLARSKRENIPEINLKGTPLQMLFNNMFKFENVATDSGGTSGLIIIPLLNITY